MINFYCVIFGHKFLNTFEKIEDYNGKKYLSTILKTTKHCVQCGLSKEECGVKLLK